MSKLLERRKAEGKRRKENNPQPAIRNPKSPLGDYSGRVPPLPIPNREVKPASADGTAKVGE
jgi:hypothetical protein